MSEDFEFYGKGTEKEEVKDIKGITDTVSEYVYSSMEYPCICLKPNLILPKHKWGIISKLSKSSGSDKNIFLYIIRKNEMFKIGKLSGIQVKSFIDIVGLDNLFGFYSKDKKLENDRLYVLSE